MSSSKSNKKLNDKLLEDFFLKRNKIAEGSICKFQDQIKYTDSKDDVPLRQERIFEKTVYRISKIDNKTYKPPPTNEVKSENLEVSLDRLDLLNEIDKNLKHLQGQKRFLEMAKENRRDKTWGEHLSANQPAKKKRNNSQNRYSERNPRDCDINGDVCKVIQRLFEQNCVKVVDSATQIESPIRHRRLSNKEDYSVSQRERSKSSNVDHSTRKTKKYQNSECSTVNIKWMACKSDHAIRRAPTEMGNYNTKVGTSKLYDKKVSGKKKKVEPCKAIDSDSYESTIRVECTTCKPVKFHAARRPDNRQDYCSDSGEKYESIYMKSYKPQNDRNYDKKPRVSNAKKGVQTQVMYMRKDERLPSYITGEKTTTRHSKPKKTGKSPRSSEKTTPRTSRTDSIDNYLKGIPFKPVKLSEEIAEYSKKKNAAAARSRSRGSKQSPRGEKIRQVPTSPAFDSGRAKQSRQKYKIYESRNLQSESQESIPPKTKTIKSRPAEHLRAQQSPIQIYRISEKTTRVEQSRRVVQKVYKKRRCYYDDEMPYISNESPTNNLSANPSMTRMRGLNVVKPNVVDDTTYDYPSKDENKEYAILPYVCKPSEEEQTLCPPVTSSKEYYKMESLINHAQGQETEPSTVILEDSFSQESNPITATSSLLQKVTEPSAVILEDSFSQESHPMPAISSQPKYMSLERSRLSDGDPKTSTSTAPRSNLQPQINSPVLPPARQIKLQEPIQSPRKHTSVISQSHRYEMESKMYRSESTHETEMKLSESIHEPQVNSMTAHRRDSDEITYKPESHHQLPMNSSIPLLSHQIERPGTSSKLESVQPFQKHSSVVAFLHQESYRHESSHRTEMKNSGMLHKSESIHEPQVSTKTAPRLISREMSYRPQSNHQPPMNSSVPSQSYQKYPSEVIQPPQYEIEGTSNRSESSHETEMKTSDMLHKSESNHELQTNTTTAPRRFSHEMSYRPESNHQPPTNTSISSHSHQTEMQETSPRRVSYEMAYGPESNHQLPMNSSIPPQSQQKYPSVVNQSPQYEIEETSNRSESSHRTEVKSSEMSHKSESIPEPEMYTKTAAPRRVSYEMADTPESSHQPLMNSSRSSQSRQIEMQETSPRRVSYEMAYRPESNHQLPMNSSIPPQSHQKYPSVVNQSPQYEIEETSNRSESSQRTEVKSSEMSHKPESIHEPEIKTEPWWGSHEMLYKPEPSHQFEMNTSIPPQPFQTETQETSFKLESDQPFLMETESHQYTMEEKYFKSESSHVTEIKAAELPQWHSNEKPRKSKSIHGPLMDIKTVPRRVSRDMTHKPESNHQSPMNSSRSSQSRQIEKQGTSPRRVSHKMTHKPESNHQPPMNSSRSSQSRQIVKQETSPRRVSHKMTHKPESNHQPPMNSSISSQPRQMEMKQASFKLESDQSPQKYTLAATHSPQYIVEEASSKSESTHETEMKLSESIHEPQMISNTVPWWFSHEIAYKPESHHQLPMNSSIPPELHQIERQGTSFNLVTDQPSQKYTSVVTQSHEYEMRQIFYRTGSSHTTETSYKSESSYKSKMKSSIFIEDSAKELPNVWKSISEPEVNASVSPRSNSDKISYKSDPGYQPQMDALPMPLPQPEMLAVEELPSQSHPVSSESELIKLKSNSEPQIIPLISSERLADTGQDQPVNVINEENSKETDQDQTVSVINEENSKESDQDKTVNVINEENSKESDQDKTVNVINKENSKERDQDQTVNVINEENSKERDQDQTVNVINEENSKKSVQDKTVNVINEENCMKNELHIRPMKPCCTKTEQSPCSSKTLTSRSTQGRPSKSDMKLKCHVKMPYSQMSHGKQVAIDTPMDETGRKGVVRPETQMETCPIEGVDSELQMFITYLQNRLKDCDEMVKHQLKHRIQNQKENCSQVVCKPVINDDTAEQRNNKSCIPYENETEDLELPLEADQISECEQEFESCDCCCCCCEEESSSDSDIPPFTGCECMREDYYKIMRLAYRKDPK